MLARKLARELVSQKGQGLAVASVTFLGVLLFVSSAAGYLDLDASYAATRSRLALADLHVATSSLRDADLESVRAIHGVVGAEGRTVVSLPVAVSGERVELRVLSLPNEGEPRLDRVLLQSGRLPDSASEVLLEKHLADHFHLAPGDSVVVDAFGVQLPLRVSGVALSAEYLWVSRDEHDVMPSPEAFGVGWMRRDAVAHVAKDMLRAAPPEALGGLPGLEVAAHPDQLNEVLVDGSADVANDALAARVRVALGEDHVTKATSWDRLPGIRLLQMDVDGYKGMAGFFPVFFLGVGAFIVSSIVGRIVDAQRGLIGTFMALGVSRRSVLAHYLAHALVLGMVGSVLGAVVGALLGPLLTHEYATELGIPFVSTHVHWGLALSGIGLGAGVAWVAGWLPAWHASRLPPASAMRPPPPATPRLARVGRRLGRAPLALRMAVRNLLGRPTRSLGTAAGVAAALVMVLTTGALLDSMKTTMTSLFVDARRYDLRVDLAVPTAEEEARAQLSSVDGVDEVEPLIVMPATIRAKGREETVELDGLAPDASLQRAMDLDGRVVAVPSGGIVLTRGLGKSLGVALGDEVSVVPIGGERSAKFEVAGFADAAIGKTASARRDDVQARFGFGRTITSVAVRAKDGRARATRSRISELSNVAHIEDLASLRTQMQGLMGLGWAMLGTMLAFSVVLAAAILFNTATLGILERTRELATLRALGRSVRELAVGITIEHAVLCVLGLALGLPIAVVTIRHVLGLYTSDLMTFPFVLSPVTVVVAAVGILFVLGLAQWPALRIVARMSLAETVRSREG